MLMEEHDVHIYSFKFIFLFSVWLFTSLSFARQEDFYCLLICTHLGLSLSHSISSPVSKMKKKIYITSAQMRRWIDRVKIELKKSIICVISLWSCNSRRIFEYETLSHFFAGAPAIDDCWIYFLLRVLSLPTFYCHNKRPIIECQHSGFRYWAQAHMDSQSQLL